MMKKVIQLPFAAVLFAPLVLILPILLGGKALFWGTPVLQFIPWRDWAWETLQAGQLPLWNPLVGMGAPLFANYQSGLLYPLNWLTFIFKGIGDTPAMAWSHTLVVAAHLMLAGVGTVFLLKSLGQNELAQAVSGLSYSLSGYLVARAGFFSINAAAAWLPWMLHFSLILTKDISIKNFLKLSSVITLQLLAGHAQTAFYSLVMTGMWVLYWAWRNKKYSNGWKRIANTVTAGGAFVGSGILAASMAAVQLSPTLEYLLHSQRASAVEYDLAMTYSFWPWRFLTILVPNLFGNPAWGNYWGYANFWEDAIYIGLLPILLAVGYLIKNIIKMFRSHRGNGKKKGSRKSSFALFLGLVILISFLLALGKNTFIFPWLYRNIPTFDLFNAPTRFTLWAVMGLAILAGFGVDGWKRPEGRGLYWTRLGTAGAVAVVIGAGIAGLFLDHVRATFILPTALAGMWGAGTGVLALTCPRERHSPEYVYRWRWAVVLWVAIDLLVAGWGLNPGIDANYYHVENHQTSSTGRFYLPPDKEYDIKFNQFFTFESFNPEKDWGLLKKTLLPNWNMMEDQAMVNNFDPMLPGRYVSWMENLHDAESAAKTELLRMMGTSAVAVHQGQGRVTYEALSGQATYAQWLPCSQVVESPSRILEMIMGGDMDYEQTVLIESKPRDDEPCHQGSVGSVNLKERDPIHSSYVVKSSHAGWVLRSTVWYPGWNAYLDGTKIPVYHGNYLFQAVQVPAGTHELQFRYQPFSLVLGAILSLIGLITAVVLGGLGKKMQTRAK